MPSRMVLRHGALRDIRERLENDATMPIVQQKRLLDILKVADDAMAGVGSGNSDPSTQHLALLGEWVIERVAPFTVETEAPENTRECLARLLDELQGYREAARAEAERLASENQQAESVKQQVAEKAAAAAGGKGGKR